MSILDNQNQLENCLDNEVYKHQIYDLINLFGVHGCRVVNLREKTAHSYYVEVYKNDFVLNIYKDNIPCGNSEQSINSSYQSYNIISHIHPIYDNGNFIAVDQEVSNLIIHREHKPKTGLFTFLRVFIENGKIILEPIHETAPILIKNIEFSTIVRQFEFRVPDWYKGYVLAVDCEDIMNVYDIFPGLQIIQEFTINQNIY